MNARDGGRTRAALVLIGLFAVAAALAAAGGCDGRPALLPNSDRQLRKSSTAFAADAARRTYPAAAPSGGRAMARAQYGLMLKQLEVINLSADDWADVEVWVNQKYVVFVPAMQHGVVKTLNFQMLFDAQGQHLDTMGGKNPITTVDLFYGGKRYDVPIQQAD